MYFDLVYLHLYMKCKTKPNLIRKNILTIMQDERFFSLESAFKAFGKKIKDTTYNIKPGSAQSDVLTVTLEHLQDKDCVLYFAYN